VTPRSFFSQKKDIFFQKKKKDLGHNGIGQELLVMLHGLVCELPPYQTLDAFFFLVCIVSVKKNSSFLSMLYSIVCQLPPYQTLDAFLFFL